MTTRHDGHDGMYDTTLSFLVGISLCKKLTLLLGLFCCSSAQLRFRQSTEYRVQNTEYRVQSIEYRVQGT